MGPRLTHVLTHAPLTVPIQPYQATGCVTLSGMRRIGLLLVTAAVIAGCGGGSSAAKSAPSDDLVAGTVHVHDAGEWLKNCRPFFATSGDDIAAGTAVTIKNAAGTTIGLAKLGAPLKSGTSFLTGTCDYAFQASVPQSKFYSLSVGSHAGQTISEAQIGEVSLTFGETS